MLQKLKIVKVEQSLFAIVARPCEAQLFPRIFKRTNIIKNVYNFDY